jgi:hypothetical protein
MDHAGVAQREGGSGLAAPGAWALQRLGEPLPFAEALVFTRKDAELRTTPYPM